MSNKKLKIALVHLRSNGDVLYATTIAKQIKEVDFPNCNLTWYISSSCISVLENNPYIDEIIEVKCTVEEAVSTTWKSVKKDVLNKKENGFYDEVFFTQIHPDNWNKFDKIIRNSIFNNYPFQIKVPISPIIVLNEKEILNVKLFALNNNFGIYNNVILFECSPNSSQSFMNLELALTITKEILKKNFDTCIILSSPYTFIPEDVRIIDGSKLSFRENAELTKYCNLLIGCSSGITWLSTSIAAKKLPMIQLLKNTNENIFASVEYDLNYFNEDVSEIIEITNENINYIVDCVNLTLKQGINQAKTIFGEILIPDSEKEFSNIFFRLIKQKKILDVIFVILKYSKKNKKFFKILILILKRFFRFLKIRIF